MSIWVGGPSDQSYQVLVIVAAPSTDSLPVLKLILESLSISP